MRVEVGNIAGIQKYTIDDISDDLDLKVLTERLDEHYLGFLLHPTYVLKNTNKPLSTYSTVKEIKGPSGVVSINARIGVLGGKGGFGANLRANKTKSGRQPKRETKDSKTYYKDLKTGVKVKDINRLKKAYDVLSTQEVLEEQEKEQMQLRKKKLQKAIAYYESMLDGSGAAQERFQDTEFLDELDDVMMEMRDSVNKALNLECESDNWESDWESSDDDQKVPQEETREGTSKDETNKVANKKPRFASFFDDDDEE